MIEETGHGKYTRDGEVVLARNKLIYVMPNERDKRLGESLVRCEKGKHWDRLNDKEQDFINGNVHFEHQKKLPCLEATFQLCRLAKFGRLP
jgi:hypothetical protein